jgi:hypothetical protein
VARIRVDTVEEGGVRQARSTVTCRFHEPGEATPPVLQRRAGGPDSDAAQTIE